MSTSPAMYKRDEEDRGQRGRWNMIDRERERDRKEREREKNRTDQFNRKKTERPT